MKPKLWDGPNPVGEARARGNEMIDTPYLTASGPGFSAHKKGAFREVYCEQGTPPQLSDGWVSSSNNAKTDVVFSGTSTIYAPFKKRGAQRNAAADAFTPGTNIRSDGKGGAFSTIHVGDERNDAGEVYARKYALVSVKGNGRRVKQLSPPLWSYVFTAAVSAGVDRLIGTGLIDGISGGMSFSTEMTTTNHNDNGVFRAHPVLHIVVKFNGSWFSGGVDLPYETSDDTDVPDYCHLGGNRIAALWGAKVTAPPKLRYSDNFGATWTEGVDVSDICAGFDPNETGSPPTKTEAEISAEDPSLNGQQVRAHYLSQPQFQRALETHLGASGLQIHPIAFNKVLAATEFSYWNGSGRVVSAAVVDVNSGVVRRTEWNVSGVYHPTLHIAQIGQGAWVAALTREEPNAEYGYATVWSKVTFDFGASYQDVNLPADAIPYSIRPIIPYKVGRERYRLIVLGTNADGDRILYRTDDLETFDVGAVVGKREWFADGDSGANFSQAVFVGTPDNPGHFYPPAPWVLDDRVPTPDWWMTS